MARTPLMNSLIRMAADCRLAEQHGLPLEAVEEARADARTRNEGLPSRRAFLAGAGTALAGLALGPTLRAGTAPRIAIVGGGIAGLTAALTLADAGLAATVYEAGGRLGGRMFSNTTYWNEGQVSEWGGELIDSRHKTILALARRFRLTVTDLKAAEPAGAEETYHFGGRYYARRQAQLDFQEIYPALRRDTQEASYPTTYNSSTPAGRALDRMSVHDWIESRVPGGHRAPLGQLLDVAYAIEYGADTTDQSSLNLVYLLGYQNGPGSFALFGPSDERYHVAGGNQQLPAAIAQYLGAGSRIQTGMRLTALAQGGNGTCTLTFTGAQRTQTLDADFVILAIPFPILGGLDIAGAGFDALKLRAIREQGRGRNGKLHLQFTDRLWDRTGPWGQSNGSSYSDQGYQNTWDVTRGQTGTSGILVNYTGGRVTEALSARTAYGLAANAQVRTDAQRFLRQIESVFPTLTPRWNGKTASSLPHLDPNLGLSYSYWRVGQYTAFAGYERARQGNVFFAGEHTSVDFQGYMEGGAAEGVRAAEEVLVAAGRR